MKAKFCIGFDNIGRQKHKKAKRSCQIMGSWLGSLRVMHAMALAKGKKNAKEESNK